MKKRLTRVSPVQLGIVLAVFYGLLSLVIFVPMGFVCAAAWAINGNSALHGSSIPAGLPGVLVGGLMMILLPVLYAGFGFVSGVIVAAVYNLIAKISGGVEFTFQDVLEP